MSRLAVEDDGPGRVLVGAVPDAIHHLAGWPALFAGARRLQRPKATLTS